MTSFGKNICANKAGGRVEEPGKQPPCLLWQKRLIKAVSAPIAWGLQGSCLMWWMKSLFGLWVPASSDKLHGLLMIGKVLVRCWETFTAPHSLLILRGQERTVLSWTDARVSAKHSRSASLGPGQGRERQAVIWERWEDWLHCSEGRCLFFIPTWYIGLINALLTASGLSQQHFPFETREDIPCSAGALGVRKQHVSGPVPLSPLMMAKPPTTALPLLFALLALANKPSSLSLAQRRCLCVLVVLFLHWSFLSAWKRVCPLGESLLTQCRNKGTPGPHVPGDGQGWLPLYDPQIDHGGARPLGSHLAVCFLLRPPKETVICLKVPP